MTKKIKVLIADDHEMVRTGIVSMLAGTNLEVVAETAGGDEAFKQSLKLKPDVVLLDIRMSAGDGLIALGRIKTERPDMPVLILSTYDNPTYVARAAALGAAGFLLKGASREVIIAAIRKAAAGESVWTRDELRRVTGALATPRLAGDVDMPLTQREAEVLKLLSRGMTNKEMAQVLHISYETVKEHVQHILRKLGVSDRTQAAVWAVRRGLV